MGSCTTVFLCILNVQISMNLKEYLSSDMPSELGHQHLHLAMGEEILKDLPGSGQAGTTRIYTALLRNISQENLLEWLRAAPWEGSQAILICQNDTHSLTHISNLGEPWPIDLRDVRTIPFEQWWMW